MASSRGTVLVVAEDLDPSADLVVTELAELNVPVVRFDLTEFPQRLTLAAEHDSTDSGWSGSLETQLRAVRLEEVRAVYYRRPGLPVIASDVAEGYREWAASQALIGMVQVLSSLPVTWMHHPDVYRASAHKPGQLATASACGLRVPRTIITNRLERARQWAKGIHGPLIVKPVGAATIPIPGRVPTILPTRRFEASELDDSLELTAHMLQEWIPKAHEVRLTAVGTELFPVAIHAGSPAAEIDWRADYDALTYEPVEVPPEVAAGVLRFMERYGLNYGAFDFAVTPDREWVFFECNPAGQWQFVAQTTNMPIARAHAKLLQGVIE